MRNLVVVTASLFLFTACGSSGDGSECGFSSTDRYLPYQVGNTWSYQVTDLADGMRTTKDQSLKATEPHPDFGAVILQETIKANGRTLNYTRDENNAVIRFRQEDYDAAGGFERATEYSPPAVRLDESPERLVQGAKWDETYAAIEKDANGTEIVRVNRVDSWEVLGVDVECSSPLGTFSCLHIRRVRTQGGVADKEYFFAKGIGKVREIGGQLEELTDCGPAE